MAFPKIPARRFLLLLLLLGLALRVLTQGWDAGTPPSPHPDERQVATVAEGLDHWFDDPGFFAYGTLHFQMIRRVTSLMGHEPRWHPLIGGGRFLSLLASLAALALGMATARDAWGDRTAVLFGLLAVWVPLDQQLSHYATVETHHALWVVAALAAMYRLGRTGRWWWALAAGAAVGASLAIKVSSLALAAPLVVALGYVILRSPGARSAGPVLPAVLGGLAAFGLGEPWAFASGRISSFHWNPRFLDDVGRQIAMVTGAADIPYVRVYAPTRPFLYAVRELFLWALGPALTLAALGAVAYGLATTWRRRRRFFRGRMDRSSLLVVLLLAWVVPMSLRLATLQVKFVRYWEPLVVPLTLLAAWALVRLTGRFGARIRILAVALTVLWGIGYLWAFVEPHPFATASHWLRTVVSSDDVVAWEHWDEHLGGIGGESVILPSYDLPDDDAKINRWCENLSRADWVVLTSNRVRRTVLANPERFPRTGRLYRLLLAGELGFEVATTASRSPRIAGLRAPVQRADESFVNYEFPRVVILRRVAAVDSVVIAALSLVPRPDLDALGSAALDRLFVEPAGHIPPKPTAGRQLIYTLLWIAFFITVGAAAWLLLPSLGSWPDAGIGPALVMGWIVPAWAMWMLSRTLGCTVGPGTATLLTIVSIAAALVVARRRSAAVRRLARTRRRGMTAVGAVFLAVFALFLAVRLFNPAIGWGEKPMDFSFFNSFVLSPHWPPGEPWMAGEPLHYYYFGEVLSAFPTLVVGADSGVAYNLMCATVPALSAAVLASFGLLIAGRRRRRLFILMPAAVLLMGNLAWPWLGSLIRAGRWFDLWWATSRVVPGFAITEYPLWTALFADLHAHFIALPVMITALLWALVVVRAPARRWIGPTVILGLTAAVLGATNPWDLPVFVGALALGVISAARRPARGLMRLAVAAGLSLIFALPFLFELHSWMGGAGGIGGRPLLFLTPGDFAPWWAVLRHFGLFIIPLAAAALVRPRRDLILTTPIVAAATATGLIIGSSAAALALGAAATFLTMIRWAESRIQALAWSLAGTGMLAVAAAEFLTLLDRMNTIFKVYNDAWVLTAAGLGMVMLGGPKPVRSIALRVFAVLAPIAVLNLPLGIYQGIVQPRVASPRPTLDGRASLDHRPSDAFLVTVLRACGRPGETIAEAAGPSYRDFVRISMQTGLPTVVGWEWHLRQRGQDLESIVARKKDLEALYTGTDRSGRRAVLDRYGVIWIVVGRLERTTYGLTGQDPLAGIPGVIPWARRNSTIVYRVDTL